MLVLEGGGVRGAFTAGVLRAFARAGLVFDEVRGTSAGAINGAFFVCGQTADLEDLWKEHVPGTTFINRWRLILPWARPVMDLDYLMDEVIADVYPIRTEGLQRELAESLVAVASRVKDSRPQELRPLLARGPEAIQMLKASAALPFAYGRTVAVDGEELFDGGFADPIPLPPEREGNITVVVLTRPAAFKKEAPGGMLGWALGKVLPDLLTKIQAQAVLYNGRMAEVATRVQTANIFVLAPPDSAKIDRLESRPRPIRCFFEEGAATAELFLHGLRQRSPAVYSRLSQPHKWISTGGNLMPQREVVEREPETKEVEESAQPNQGLVPLVQSGGPARLGAVSQERAEIANIMLQEYAQCGEFIRWCATQIFIIFGAVAGSIGFVVQRAISDRRFPTEDIADLITGTNAFVGFAGAWIAIGAIFFVLVGQALRINQYWIAAFQRARAIEKTLNDLYAGDPLLRSSSSRVMSFGTNSWSVAKNASPFKKRYAIAIVSLLLAAAWVYFGWVAVAAWRALT
ncbi:MAG: patatin-like phospholipase family protein [Myxococcota bacterium]